MAERRMFAKTITESDAFLDMSLSAQALYMHLGMNADDDGFVNNAKSIKRKIGAADDDMRVLAAKKFILVFDDGIIVIKHWDTNNYIRADRKHDTKYADHLAMLQSDEQGIYHLVGNCLPSDGQSVGSWSTEVRLGKDRLGKDKESKGPHSKRFEKPTVEEVAAYIIEKGYTFDSHAFVAYYESVGWKIGGKTPMKDWKSACCTWQRREKTNQKAVVHSDNSIYD